MDETEESQDVENKDTEYRIFYNTEDVDNFISDNEMKQTTKFILNRVCKSFGNPIDKKNTQKQRIKWIASGVKFIGQPFILVGDKSLDCRHGKDKNVAKKIKYRQDRENLLSSGDQSRINASRKSDQVKLGCPARIQIRDILVFTDYCVKGVISKDGSDSTAEKNKKDIQLTTSYLKNNSQRRQRDKTSAEIRSLIDKGIEVRTQRQFHVTFPTAEAHKGHELGQAAGTAQPVDKRLIQRVHQLVSEGVIHVEEMKCRLDSYVTTLFDGQSLPDKSNRRFYPLAKDLSNHIQKAMTALMEIKSSGDNLKSLTEVQEKTTDRVFFRSDEDNQSCLLYVHQTLEQQKLFEQNPNAVFTLDVKYRSKKSSKPLFLVTAQIGNSFKTVATFIIQEETTENIKEALEMLKSYNSRWSPAQWLVDFVSERIRALQDLFPCSSIAIRDHHVPGATSVNSKKAKKRKSSKEPSPPPPPDPPPSLRDRFTNILTELSFLADTLPNTDSTETMVNNLEGILQQLKSACGQEVPTSDTVETTQNAPRCSVSMADHKRQRDDNHMFTNPSQQPAHHMPLPHPYHLVYDTSICKIPRNDIGLPIRNTLSLSNNFIQSDLVEGHQSHLSHHYMNPHQQLLLSSQSLPTDQAVNPTSTLQISTASATAAQSLIAMNSNNLHPIGGLLANDGYHLTDNQVYTQLEDSNTIANRQYIEYKSVVAANDSNSYVQRISKLSS